MELLQAPAQVLLMLLPSGWLNSFTLHVLVEQSPLGWLFLLPVGVAAGYVAHAIRRPLVIREFCFEGTDLVAITLENGETLAISPLRRKPKHAFAEEGPRASDLPLSETQLRDQLRRGNLLKEPQWRARQWLDRLVSRRLTRRERAVLQVCGDNFGAHTREFAFFAVGLAVASAIAWFAPARKSLSLFSIGVLSTAVMASIREDAKRTLGTAFVGNYFPIGVDEPLWVNLKARFLVLPFWLVPTIVAARYVSLHHQQSLAGALNAAAWPTCLYWALRPLISLVLYSQGTDDTSNPLFRIGAHAMAFLAIGAPAIGVLGALLEELVGNWSIALPWIGVTILIAIVGFAWKLHHWAFCHLSIDVIPLRRPS